MTDDKIVKDTARDPEDETTGPVRSRVRAAAKKATKKVARKAAQKTTTGKTATARKTTKKVAMAATKTEQTAPARDAPAKTKAASAKAGAATPKATAAKSKVASAKAGTATPKGTAAKTAAPETTSGSEIAASGVTTASEGVATDSAAPAVPPDEAGPSIEAPRPPAPIHPGASMDTAHEHTGGLGSLLALWGPLIIVGFLVLVFRGGEERGNTVAAGTDALTRVAAGAPAETARAPQGGAVGSTFGSRPPERMSAPSGAAHESAGAFDGAGRPGGFAMRTSMGSASTPAGRGPGAAMPTGSPGKIYPSPPGPYRDPRYRELPTGESWPAAGANEWIWPAESRDGSGHDEVGDVPTQWVRCAPPYYWCPAPSSPTW